jgi:hypothetical protein
MKKCLAVVALAAVLTQPAAAITFSKLTTIYVGSGVASLRAGVGAVNIATAFSCSNVSGQNANVRVLVLAPSGAFVADHSALVAHGASITVSTSIIAVLTQSVLNGAGNLRQGTVNIESTQSAVFCTAMILDPESLVPSGVALRLVRINPHPGAVE